jgi:hypothetical protein
MQRFAQDGTLLHSWGGSALIYEQVCSGMADHEKE